MKIIKLKDKAEVGQATAKIFIEQINGKPNSVLGLATGSSPIETYQDLIKAYENHEVSFKDVTTFNLDEYVGLKPGDEQSYRYFMDHNLFDHIDIDKKNTHIPDAYDTSNPESYDEQIAQAGGIDLQLLGLGVNGHIGFNEPGASFDSKTSVVDLVAETIETNSRFFESIDEVPTKAVSMGLGSIMKSRKIVLIATGANKAEAIKHLVNDETNAQWPVTLLKKHADVTIIIDAEAASKIN